MKFSLILILILLPTINSLAQKNNDDVLAKVGDKIITVEEFKNRYELTPQINRKSSNKQKGKEEFLYTIIAENLFALEAERNGFDTLSAIKENYIPLEKMYVRDALYQTEISEKVKFNSEKFNDGIQLINYKCFVEYIYAKEEVEIKKAYNHLNSNANFDSLVTLIDYAEYVAEPYEVNYGQMYPYAETEIYNLEINEFTKPIQAPEGWFIFRLISKIPTNFSYDQKYSKVKEAVENRSEDSIYNDYWKNFFVGKEVTTDGSLFWYFAEKVHETINEIKNDKKIKDGEKIKISHEDFVNLKNTLHSDSLKKEFIKFSSKPISLEEFLTEFSFEGFYSFATDLNTIAAQLNSRVKRQIELELLAGDGYKRGLESLPEVQNSTKMWKDNYLSTLFLKDVVRKTELSKNEISSFVEQNNSDSLSETKVNIIEILTDSLEVIKEALNLSGNSELFKNFAKQHTKRDSLRDRSGEFGFRNSSDLGEIGKIAESMEIGDVFGPLETSEGFSVFKVIDKKKEMLTHEEVVKNENIKNQLKYKKIMDNLENMAADLADKHKVTINNELLNSLNLLNAQMVVFRYMGFGGRIQAFPYSTPFYKWKEKWEQKKKDLL